MMILKYLFVLALLIWSRASASVETVTADHCKNGGTLNPCQHGGSHVDYDENGDRICLCMPGYSGPLCETPDNDICPPLANNVQEGGRCRCNNAPGWTETGGWMMYCSNRECYSKQEFENCTGEEWSDIGDGTWCQDGKRHTKCKTVREADCGCGAGWESFERNCYKASSEFSEFKNWTSAEIDCMKKGAHLTSIQSEAENSFLIPYANHAPFAFTGGRRTNESSFSWTDGKPFNYENWEEAEPWDGYDCIGLMHQPDNHPGNGKWVGVDCDSPHDKYICKKTLTGNPNCLDRLPTGWNSSLEIWGSPCGTCSDLLEWNSACYSNETFENYASCFNNAFNAQMASRERIKDYCRCSCDGCACYDTSNDATDSNGDKCSYYLIRKEQCGMYDDEDFSANEMCCECKEWTYCPGNYEHIKKNWMCDGLVSCRDGSDEICCGNYTGPECQRDPCSIHDCYNGASCVNENGMATCVCPQGFSGNQCQFPDNGICPDKERRFGGRCDCTNATGWSEMGGWTIGCNYFGCFAEQEYNGCVGMKDKRLLGDGTWCYDNKRQTQCTIVIEKDCGDCTDTLPDGWNSEECGTCSTGLATPYSCQPWHTFEYESRCFRDGNAGNASQEKIKDWCKCSCDSCDDCIDSNNGATDRRGKTCDHYNTVIPGQEGNGIEDCGLFDDDDFSANEMCCGCKEWTFCKYETYPIKKNQICDGKVDCIDCSDEKNCGNETITTTTTPATCMGGDTCCNEANKCDVGEGDCDLDEDCLEGLKCGSNNCLSDFGWEEGWFNGWDQYDDCCYKPGNETITTTSPPVNGGWGPWEPWGECSVSCGGGEKMKNRKCNSPPPSNGGKNCRGKSKKTKRCNKKSCCRNVWPKRQCRKAKKQGKCTTDSSVQDNCKKTCKICN